MYDRVRIRGSDWTALYLLACGGLLLLPMLVHTSMPTLLLMAVAALPLASYPAYRGLRHGHLDFFEPPLLVVAITLPLLLRPLYWLITQDINLAGYPVDQERAVRAAALAAGYLLLGQFCYYVGYYNRYGYRPAMALLPRFQARWSPRRLYVLLTLYAVVGLGCYGTLAGHLGGVREMLASLYYHKRMMAGMGPLFVGVMLVPAAAMLWLAYRALTRKQWFLWAVLFLLVLAMLSTLGSRGVVLIPVLFAVTCWHYLFKPLRFLQLVVCAVAMIVFSVSYQDVRNSTAARGGMELEVLGNLDWSASSLLEGHFADQNYLDTFAILVDDMPRTLEFQQGRTWLALLVWPVPRKWWPDKPLVYEGSLLGEAYFGGWARPCTYAGVLYMNFQVPGIIVGYLLLGFFHRSLYEYLRANASNRLSVVFYAGCVTLLTNFTNLAITNWLLFVLPVWVGMRMVSGGAPRWSPAGQDSAPDADHATRGGRSHTLKRAEPWSALPQDPIPR